MAISTYSELQTAVSNWLDDAAGSQASSDRVKEFIALAEADISARLRCRRNIETQTGTVAQASFELPAYFGGIRSLSIAVGGYYQPLAQMERNAAIEAYYGYGSGAPQHFALDSTSVLLFPEPDGDYSYSLVYYKRIVPLSDQNTSNWLLTDYPSVYLFGALSHAFGYLVNDQRMATWRAQYEAALEAVHQASIAESASGRSFMYVEGGTP